MQPLRDMPTEDIHFLLFDVDDTITERGCLTREAANAIYDAADFGLKLIAVTGRSFSWGEMLLRLFPLEVVIAETGAVALVRTTGGVSVVHHESEGERESLSERRRVAQGRLLRELPGTRLALDNAGRLYDIAVDLVESGPLVTAREREDIHALLKSEGFVTSESSVHINAWPLGMNGPFDKLTMTKRIFREHILGAWRPEHCCYVGDSLNDGVMFAAFARSVGVSNVRRVEEGLRALGQLPPYVTPSATGLGFSELVKHLCSPLV